MNPNSRDAAVFDHKICPVCGAKILLKSGACPTPDCPVYRIKGGIFSDLRVTLAASPRAVPLTDAEVMHLVEDVPRDHRR